MERVQKGSSLNEIPGLQKLQDLRPWMVFSVAGRNSDRSSRLRLLHGHDSGQASVLLAEHGRGQLRLVTSHR